MSLLHVSQSLHLSSTELFHLFFLFTAWGVFSLVWTLLHEPQEKGVLTEALAFVRWWAGWAGRVRHPCRGLERGAALMTLGAWAPRWLRASSPPGDKARGLEWNSTPGSQVASPKAALASDQVFLPWFTKGNEAASSIAFPSEAGGLESYVNQCLDWHTLGKSILYTLTDGWHTCFPESQFKKQFTVSLV